MGVHFNNIPSGDDMVIYSGRFERKVFRKDELEVESPTLIRAIGLMTPKLQVISSSKGRSRTHSSLNLTEPFKHVVLFWLHEKALVQLQVLTLITARLRFTYGNWVGLHIHEFLTTKT